MSAKDRNFEIEIGGFDWGGVRRQEPVSNMWGFDRGLPIDRYYIERFLASHALQIKGHCLEVKDSGYTRKFGGDRVSASDVLDINPANHHATIIGDLAKPDTLGRSKYDCIILTQVLPHIFDFISAFRNCFEALKIHGTLLLSVPVVVSYAPEPGDYWRITGAAMEKMISELDGCPEWKVTSYGNLTASIGFLLGLASCELKPEELEYFDPHYPIVVTTFIKKQDS